MAAATFSPAVIHAALRIWSAAPASLLCISYRREAAAPKSTAKANRARSSRRNSPCPGTGARAGPGRAADGSGSPGAPAFGSIAWYAAAFPAMRLGVCGGDGRIGAARRAVREPACRRNAALRMIAMQYLVPAILGILLALALLMALVVIPAIEQKRYQPNSIERRATLSPRCCARRRSKKRSTKTAAELRCWMKSVGVRRPIWKC